jgi:hypothetical protein
MQRVVLLCWCKGLPTTSLDIFGSFYSLEHLHGPRDPITVLTSELEHWSPKLAVPCPPVAGVGLRRHFDAFIKHPRLADHEPSISSGMHGKASDFRRWTLATDEGGLRPDLFAVQARNVGIVAPNLRTPSIAESVLDRVPEQVERQVLSFAQVTQQDNDRALRLCVLPPRCLVKETAYYLDVGADQRRVGFYLSILGSVVFDWYARFWIGYRALPSMVLALSVPAWDCQNIEHLQVADLALEAAEAGTRFGADVEARVARIIGIGDVTSLLETYHWGKDFSELGSSISSLMR